MPREVVYKFKYHQEAKEEIENLKSTLTKMLLQE